MSEILYTETQWFRKTPWLFFIIPVWLFMVVTSVYSVYSQLVLKIPLGTNPMSDTMLLFTTFLSISFVTALLILFLISRLEVIVSGKGLFYRFVPFFNKFRYIKPIEIAYYETRQYSPIKDFWGWGIRYNLKEKINCYNVRGNLGLYLELKNGKKILFGSQNPHKFKSAIDKLLGVNKNK